MRPRRAGDHATTHTLEAVVIATVMVASVAFVVTFQVPDAPNQGSRALVEARARDALGILADVPVTDSPLGTNLMSVSIMECLQGDCGRLERKLAGVLPKGAQYAVYLSNGAGLYPVYAPRSPPGEAVSSEHLFEPQWSYSFLGPAMEMLNPTSDPLVVYDLPVVNSNVLSPGGNVLEVVVRGTRLGDSSDYVMRTTVSTRAATASSGPTPAVSLYFANATGGPIASLDSRATTLSGLPLELRVRLNESAGVAVPAGTNLTVRLPRGWIAQASVAHNAPNWTIQANATDFNGSASGSDVVATLKHAVSNATVDLLLNATYRGDQEDVYVLRAGLSQGAYATAALLVTADSHATLPAFEVPTILVSAPRPMGLAANTTWTLAAHVPESPSAGFPESVVVTRIDVTESEGAPIFGAVTNISGDGGVWTTNGSALTWTGARVLTHHAPLNLTFQVTASGNAGSAVERAPFAPSLELGGWSARLAEMTSPGMFRQTILPSDLTYRGYNASTGAWLEANHSGNSTSVYRATALPGTLNYTAGHFSLLRDAVFGSDIGLSARRVPVGGTAEVAVNVQSVAYDLARLGMKPVITLNLYPPWSGDTRTPVWSEVLFDAPEVLGTSTLMSLVDGNGDGTPEASDVGRYEADIPIGASWLFGPYVLEVEITWEEDVSATVEGSVLTLPLVRTVHLYDYLLATPPDTISPASPIYNARLVVWFDDWQ